MPRLYWLLAVVVACGAVAAANVALPNPSTGNVNGKTGLLYWPSVLPKGPNQPPQPLPTADGCDVHLVPFTNLDRELTYPCGKWFAPPRDRYLFWLETSGAISPQSIVIYNASPFTGRGLAAMTPLAPAGRVGIPPDKSLPEAERLHVLSLQRGDWWNRGSSLVIRRVTADRAKAPIQMPLGRVVMGRFDRGTNDAIAIARPVELRADRTASVWPEPPAASDLLVALTKPAEMHGGPSRLVLNDRAPDVMVDARDQLLAIWYDLDLSRGTLSLQSDVAFWESREVRFTRGKVTTLRGELRPLPKARVSINAPLDAPKLSIEVKRAAEAKAVRRVDVNPGVHEIESLPAEPLRVTLNVGEWKLTQDVDLRSGQDAALDFDVQLIAVKGTVYYGDEPARAEIEFRNDEEWRVVKTNDRGEYETLFWWPGVHTARVKVAGRGGAPFLDAFREVFESGSVDFHVPRTDYTVHVRDAVTHDGIAGARVSAGSIAAEGGLRSAQHVITDDHGTAVLPPVRKGELIVDIRAERYAVREPLRLTVDDEHHVLDVDLQPLQTAATLRFVLPNGAAAARAEAWAFNDAIQPLWRGAADEEGQLEVPDIAANALLLVRHANAASTIRRVSIDEKTWSLEAPAEAVTFTSERKNALVSLWLDGVKLSGPPLVFAAWSTMMMTNGGGVWIGRNLPAKPLRIAAGEFPPKN